MLTSDYLDILSEPIIDLFEEYQKSVIKDIARRLAKMNFVTPTAAWQLQRAIESGATYEDILKKIEQLTPMSEKYLNQAFKQAGVKAVKFDDLIYKKAGLNPLPLNLSPAMKNVLAAGLRKTGNLINNLVMTTAETGQELFVNAADSAYMKIVTGAFDYNTAIRQSVKEAAREGLKVINFASGRRDQLDVSMRRAVLTGVGQTAGNLTIERANEMGTDLVQVSAHIGARNKGTGPGNHESWQGGIYSRSGTHKKHKNFYKVTGFGTITGLHGINCRHSFFPFFEGISENEYTKAILESYADETVIYNGEEISFYEATQKQRAIEREIRKVKREASALAAAGQDNTQEIGEVKSLQAVMRDFIKQTDLDRQYIREGGRVKRIKRTEV